ncbi:3-methyl-2-oxobutanoate dehydrogenase subunit VorB [Peptoniphilus sp. AGMB00490]|uniref:3-methyl-2-oxobutanoate dehydrogenase subunit VorB n=1 Tax=Peptoniphilus faecalis TaxID=2731255 RepID=A0A848R8V6_9FIRM|nr:3-methyl-2-oxobutanoate dehydrogenase subunit VorB [Peptoniphilus faecalis]NMW85747.1 3-methyl-2-oxobutanoate dehydrogenase subunit VorB [Peptoniphilus faecalis]
MRNFELMKGNEAIAEAALRAGCRFYAGYPITPQSEILEYMSKNMEKYGGVFIQGENEVASISMLWGAAAAGARCMTSSSGPGYDLKQEGISYLSSYHIPAVIVDAMRFGTGDGEITAGQDSYNLAVRGGGHGDSRQIVLAPASVNECASLTYKAFDLAEKYRNVVIILTDGAISQLVEKCILPEAKEHNIDKFDWTITGKSRNSIKNRITNLDRSIGFDAADEFYINKTKKIYNNEQRWEEVNLENADLILVAYGISSRVSKSAIELAKKEGINLGLIRPISVWPFPNKAFVEAKIKNAKGIVTVEMALIQQMALDVKIASENRKPLYSYLTGRNIPSPEGIVNYCKEIFEGKIKEVEVY